MTAKKADEIQNFPELTEAEKTAAEKEGVKAAIKQSAQTNFTTRSATESDAPGDRWPDRHEIMRWEHLLSLDLVAFEEAIDAKAEPAVPESKVAGLVELERSGKNRKQYCDILTKRLGVSSVYEVTSAGPGYMNEVSQVTAIKK